MSMCLKYRNQTELVTGTHSCPYVTFQYLLRVFLEYVAHITLCARVCVCLGSVVYVPDCWEHPLGPPAQCQEECRRDTFICSPQRSCWSVCVCGVSLSGKIGICVTLGTATQIGNIYIYIPDAASACSPNLTHDDIDFPIFKKQFEHEVFCRYK